MGDPSTSDTGFPEGDPLSVIAMLVVSHLFAQSLEATDDTVHMDTYADNWEWTCSTVPSNMSALRWAAQFAQDVMMPVAWDKVWTWATLAEWRRQLRAFVVENHKAPPAEFCQRSWCAYQLYLGPAQCNHSAAR